MRLDDYLTAVSFRAHVIPPPLSEWADELRIRAGIESFRGIG